MRPFLLILSCLIFSACDHTSHASKDFLDKANIFWMDAVSNNCIKAKDMVRYPVLMDGISVDSEEKLFRRCNAISTSAKYLEKKTGVPVAEGPSFTIHEKGWLKQEVLAGHPLLKAHTGNDVSFFLLEVITKNAENQPITFIFRRDYEDKNGSWDIIMLEDYSLTSMMNKKEKT